MYVPRDRYSLTMSFWVVPRSSPRRRPALGERDVQGEQPHRRGVDRHRRVHLLERDPVEQRAHVAEVGDRHADLADLAPRQRRVGVVAGLGRQVERDRQPRLALGQVGAVQLVRRLGASSGPSRSASSTGGLSCASSPQCCAWAKKYSSQLTIGPKKQLSPTGRKTERIVSLPPDDGSDPLRFPFGGNPAGRMADSAGDALGAGGGGPPAPGIFPAPGISRPGPESRSRSRSR